MRDLLNLPIPPSNPTPSSQKLGSNSLSIQDLPTWVVKEQQLKEYIYEFSKIKPVSCKIIVLNANLYGAASQKSGFITFESVDDAACVHEVS